MKNKVILTFGIWDFTDITHQEITDILGLQPVKVHVLGEKINPKFLQVAKKNGWMYSFPNGEFEPFENQMNELMSLLKDKSEGLKRLTSKYYCELSCAVFKKNEEDSIPWIHLKKDHIAFLNEFSIEFDLDLYA